MSELKNFSDEDLMKLYQEGSELAFETIFQRYSGRILGFLKKRIIGQRIQEDLLQEIFLKLHRSKHLYNSTLPFSPWIFSVTRSVMLDYLKKKKLEDPTDVSEFDQLPSFDRLIESQNNLPELLEQLPQSQQQAIQLRVYDEKTFEEIAVRLATSPENARQLFSRGLKKIKSLIGRKD